MHGIRVRGKPKLGAVPERARLLYVAQSETFDLVLKRMNKYSSNFVAEQLLKTLGAEVKGPPGTTANGVSVAEEFLEREVGIPRGSYILRNGSGLNDTNRFTPRQLTQLLKVMWDRFPLAPEYLSSVGIAGKDGTLRYRFEGSEAVGRLRAKTGTLENVSALSGYVQSVGGERFAFSVLVNDFAGRTGPVVQGIDAIGAAVAAVGAPGGPDRAVATLLQPAALGAASNEEAKARIKTYLAVAQKADQRNLPFLRTAWRSERDPAVRAVLADSIYQTDPRDYLGSRALLDSFTAGDEVYGRLRQLARELERRAPLRGQPHLARRRGERRGADRGWWSSPAPRAATGARSAPSPSALADVARTAPDELPGRPPGGDVRGSRRRPRPPGAGRRPAAGRGPSALARGSQADGLHRPHGRRLRPRAGRHALPAHGRREGARGWSRRVAATVPPALAQPAAAPARTDRPGG